MLCKRVKNINPMVEEEEALTYSPNNWEQGYGMVPFVNFSQEQ